MLILANMCEVQPVTVCIFTDRLDALPLLVNSDPLNLIFLVRDYKNGLEIQIPLYIRDTVHEEILTSRWTAGLDGIRDLFQSW